ncbi:MAG: BrnA antitoxin family protein [Candidatus Desulfatibia sp.]|uniref:BrnA antitoxin family protein n=1 Tax=Candidatus Desulfatibia sp. TaxID=3101189 RepID=UPI002F2CAF7D
MKKKPDHIKQEDWDAVESPPLSNKILSRMQPVRKAHSNMPSRVRGPQKKPTKKQLTIRLNQEVVEYFKLQGKGWQTKINEVLTDYVHSHNENDPGI